ncbi:DUF4333 domain-containing protein [Dermacoccaceae bacterium W4C1]
MNGTRSVRRGLVVGVGALALVAGLSACDQQVKTDDLESQLTSGLQKESPAATFTDAQCADELKAEKDATVECTIKINGTTQTYIAKAESVDGSKVKLRFSPKL